MDKSSKYLWITLTCAAAIPAAYKLVKYHFYRSHIHVLVASKSAIKLKAVQDAFCRIVSSTDIHGVDVPSLVSEQPYGLDETVNGVRNRLNGAIKASLDLHSDQEKEFSYIVAIENGLLDTQETKENSSVWFDIGIVAIYVCRTKQTFYATSGGITFPPSICIEMKSQFENTTVGSQLAQRLQHVSIESETCNSKDPHSFLTGGSISRFNLLSNAIELCLSQAISFKNYVVLPKES